MRRIKTATALLLAVVLAFSTPMTTIAQTLNGAKESSEASYVTEDELVGSKDETKGEVTYNDPSVTHNDPGSENSLSEYFDGNTFNIQFVDTLPSFIPPKGVRWSGTRNSSIDNLDPTTIRRADGYRLQANQRELSYFTFDKWEVSFTGVDDEEHSFSFDDQADITSLFQYVSSGQSLVFYGTWKPIELKINYHIPSGKNNTKNKSTITIMDSVKYNETESYSLILADPVDGGAFHGWYSDAGYTNLVSEGVDGIAAIKCLNVLYPDSSSIPEAGIDLYAKMTNNTYNIKFVANGGSGSMSPIKGVNFSDKVKLPAATFTRKGMNVKSWNTKADGSGTSYANKATVKGLTSKDGATVTLYAQWEYTKYKIVYQNMSGATNNASNPSTYTIKSSKITFKAPTKKGYVFAGWYTTSKYKTQIKTIPAGSTGNINVFAKWTPIKYNLAFNANGGKGTMSKKTSISYGSTITLPKNKFTRDGYLFTGWNIKKDGSSNLAYTDAQKVKNVTATNGKTVTLYAQWKSIRYNIKFDGNGATSGSMASLRSCEYGKAYKLSQNKFKRNGYKFVGWNTKKDGSGTAYKDLASVKNLAKKHGSTVVLYARWVKKSIHNYTDAEMFEYFINNGKMTTQGSAGLLGNLKAESDLRANNLQNTFNETLKMTDEEYTDAVDSGTYTNFVNDQAGYGLAQWTSPGRKQALLNYARSKEVSISDYDMQLEFLLYELTNGYTSVYKVLTSTNSVKKASDKVLTGFEKPKDQSATAKAKRAAIGTDYFKRFRPNEKPEPSSPTMTEEDCPFQVKSTTVLNVREGAGTDKKVVGTMQTGATTTIIHVSAGTGSAKGWGQRQEGGWIALDYVTKID